jgi:hypothetical protein
MELGSYPKTLCTEEINLQEPPKKSNTSHRKAGRFLVKWSNPLPIPQMYPNVGHLSAPRASMPFKRIAQGL